MVGMLRESTPKSDDNFTKCGSTQNYGDCPDEVHHYAQVMLYGKLAVLSDEDFGSDPYNLF